ncbi:MAG: thioesterase family protein [Clostridia bacterium]
MFESQTNFIVRYAETDQMGIVHHSNYPIWFEAGRTDFIRKTGMPYSKIEEAGILLPLLELCCTYKGFAKYEDSIKVKTFIKETTITRITFGYEVYKNDEDEIITLGHTIHTWTNKDLKPINIKKHSPELFEIISKALI